MQSFTMTHKRFSINRRQIPRPAEEEEKEEEGGGGGGGRRRGGGSAQSSGGGVGVRKTWRLVGRGGVSVVLI